MFVVDRKYKHVNQLLHELFKFRVRGQEAQRDQSE